jgi:signal transduction histidine kinase
MGPAPDGSEPARDTPAGRAETMAQLAARLHDLCQPLTALQCRLELFQMQGAPGELFEGVSECLRECARMNQLTDSMRELVQRGESMEEKRVG